MSNTIITSTGDKLSSKFDQRFGRAAWFCLYNETTKEVQFIKNDQQDQSQGAGSKSAETVIELKVQKVISGDFGPKAKELLNKFNIQMVIIQESDLSISEIIDKLKDK